ncbi:MAG: hypothetical protein ACYDBH_01410 [Acidobacteriaceae bacterium]
MSATEIARKTLAPGEGHYEKLTRDEIYSLCCAVLDAEAYRARVERVALEMRNEHPSHARAVEWAAQLTEKGDD